MAGALSSAASVPARCAKGGEPLVGDGFPVLPELAGRLLERRGNASPRGMIVWNRIRLTRRLHGSMAPEARTASGAILSLTVLIALRMGVAGHT